jgi:hypothetical protein
MRRICYHLNPCRYIQVDEIVVTLQQFNFENLAQEISYAWPHYDSTFVMFFLFTNILGKLHYHVTCFNIFVFEGGTSDRIDASLLWKHAFAEAYDGEEYITTAEAPSSAPEGADQVVQQQ